MNYTKLIIIILIMQLISDITLVVILENQKTPEQVLCEEYYHHGCTKDGELPNGVVITMPEYK